MYGLCKEDTYSIVYLELPNDMLRIHTECVLSVNGEQNHLYVTVNKFDVIEVQ